MGSRSDPVRARLPAARGWSPPPSRLRYGRSVGRINADDIAANLDELWAPRLVAQVNDTSVKLAKVRGEFVWHTHPDSDELFLVRSGSLTIRTDDEDIQLGPGDVYVVPRGERHCPVSETGAEVVLIERTGTLSTGDFAGEIPAHITSTTGLPSV